MFQFYFKKIISDNCIVNLNSDNCKKIKQEDTLENEDSRSNKKEKEFISETDGCRTLINKQELKEENCNEEDDDYLLNNEKYSEKVIKKYLHITLYADAIVRSFDKEVPRV